MFQEGCLLVLFFEDVGISLWIFGQFLDPWASLWDPGASCNISGNVLRSFVVVSDLHEFVVFASHAQA